MNKVIISGRLARDPEMRYSQGAEPMAITRISVAVNRRFKRDGEPDADFINCVAFGKTAEFISKYFSKGKMIGIVGNLRNNNWTDNNGQKRYSTEVHIEEAEFLESKAQSEANSNNSYANSQPTLNQDKPSDDDFYSIDTSVDDDNLPF